jgi:phage/plasmid-associated DNA primase
MNIERRQYRMRQANEEATAKLKPLPALPAGHVYTLPRPSGDNDTPTAIAMKIIGDHQFISEAAGSIFGYNGRYLEKITETELRRLALAYDVVYFTTQRRRGEVLAYIRDASYVTEIPWRQLAASEVPCFNGVVDVHTSKVRPHRYGDFLETVVPFPYDLEVMCPTWLAALDVWFTGAEGAEKTGALQEFMGYCLLPHARYKKAPFLYGESNTGKSQVPLVIKELVGAANHCSISTEEMADPREREDIVGKMVNLLTELPGVLAWCVEGADRLIRNNGEFTHIEESARAVGEYRESENPMNDFLKERTDEEEDGAISLQELHETFLARPGTRYGRKQVTRMVKSAGVSVGFKWIDGRNVPCAFGRSLPLMGGAR